MPSSGMAASVSKKAPRLLQHEQCSVACAACHRSSSTLGRPSWATLRILQYFSIRFASVVVALLDLIVPSSGPSNLPSAAALCSRVHPGRLPQTDLSTLGKAASS